MTSATTRKVFTLLVEMRCNSFCIFCGQRQVDDGVVKARRSLGLATPETSVGAFRGRFTLATATAALEAARAEGYDELSLQGGEPTLFADLVPLVDAAKALGFTFVGLVTNGRRLKDRKLTRALLDAGLDGITFSVLGPDAETHDALAIAPGSFDELVLGIQNAAHTIAELGKETRLNVNLITSKDTAAHLAEQVEALHVAGAHASSIHLVRFDGLASDPLVKRALAFDIRALTPELGRAWDVADRVGARMHATDVPVCLHPELRPSELELLERRAAVSQHGYGAASFAYDLAAAGEASEIRCEACLLRRVCPRVPREYVPEEPSEALRPLTILSLAAGVETMLATLDPEQGASVVRVRDRKRALASIARVGVQADLSRPMARLDEALADLAALALARDDLPSVVLAFGARLGLHAPAWSEDVVRGWGAADVRELARAAHAVPKGGARRRLRLAAGFDLALEGDATLPLRVRPVHRPARSLGDRILLALFLAGLPGGFAGAEDVRIVARAIEVLRGGVWARALSLDSASEARWVDSSEE
jgi:molybdenum cofactor biosynthesis enzyme MoaA